MQFKLNKDERVKKTNCWLVTLREYKKCKLGILNLIGNKLLNRVQYLVATNPIYKYHFRRKPVWYGCTANIHALFCPMRPEETAAS